MKTREVQYKRSLWKKCDPKTGKKYGDMRRDCYRCGKNVAQAKNPTYTALHQCIAQNDVGVGWPSWMR